MPQRSIYFIVVWFLTISGEIYGQENPQNVEKKLIKHKEISQKRVKEFLKHEQVDCKDNDPCCSKTFRSNSFAVKFENVATLPFTYRELQQIDNKSPEVIAIDCTSGKTIST